MVEQNPEDLETKEAFLYKIPQGWKNESIKLISHRERFNNYSIKNMTGESSRMDVKDNSPDDLKAIDLSTYNSDLTATLISKNSETRQKCWDGVAESLGTQDSHWHWGERQKCLTSWNSCNSHKWTLH